MNAGKSTRRNVLSAGLLTLGGLTLPDLYRVRAARGTPRKTNVILFWMSGGPGHMETWDPKPEAVTQYRGPFGAIPTNVPGIQFGELLPCQARLMDKLAVVRTVNHGSGDHTKANHWMLTAYEGPSFNAADLAQRKPALGSCVSLLRGANQGGMPPYVAVPHLRGGTDNFYHYAAYLGGNANPFIVDSDPNLKGFRVKNMALAQGLSPERLQDRRGLLDQFDRLRRHDDAKVADMDLHYQRAFELLTSPRVAAAFDINAEQPAIRERYGRHTFGQSALLARRLIESGVTFVTVNCEPWDHHGTGGRHKTDEGAKLLIPPFDRALAGLIEDLNERGLYDDTLVVAMGEFGRTPRMNADAGRDHWGHAFSILMGCGSMRMGQTIGRTTPRGEYVVDRPVSPSDVAATIYRHLGIDGRNTTVGDREGRPTYLLEEGQPIRELEK
ncbi:MAG: DUF1501 domain-containing protein [Gemmataceae bacterium]